MKPTNTIGFLLQHLSFSLARQSDQVLQEKFGIGFSQFKIMMVLQRQPHVRQNQIAEKLGQTEASISRQIKLMDDEGLLQSVKRPDNRREHIITLTTRGIRMTEDALALLNDFHAPMFKSLSSTQQAELLSSLTTLHEYVCQAEACQTFTKK